MEYKEEGSGNKVNLKGLGGSSNINNLSPGSLTPPLTFCAQLLGAQLHVLICL